MIFRFKPITKPQIWGSESWEISGVALSESVIQSGEHKGVSLPDLISLLKHKLVGKDNFERFGCEFPLLIKFIDAKEPLSIQVHPNDEMAQARHGKKGKTEMWYVAGATQDASLKVGFSQSITPTEYESRIADNTICDVIRDYSIDKGDVFFLPAGRIHAIGAGAYIAEIQQTSDVTYRIYDYDRKDASGNGRELHTELSKDAINYEVLEDYKADYPLLTNEKIELASCPYFTTDLYDLDKPMTLDLNELDSFVVVMCVEGGAEMITNGAEIVASDATANIKNNQTLLLSAETTSVRIHPTPNCKLLLAYIK